MRFSRGLLSTIALLTVSCATTSGIIFLGCSPADEQKPPAREIQPAAAPIEPAQTAAPAVQPAETAPPAVQPAGAVLTTIPDPPDGMPPAPKVSTYAPAEDLAVQAEKYVKDLEKTVAGDDEFKYIQEKIAKDANTLVVIALALGLHDEGNKYKDRAGALMRAASELAAVKDFESAKKGVAAVREAADGKRKADLELKWGRTAALPELMKQVPLVNTKLKRYVKGERFKSKARLTAGYTAVIAAIAQGSMADLSETKNAEQVKQWFEFMAAMRDSAGALNAAVHKGDEPAGAEAMKKLSQSCNDCHAVFHPEAEVEQ